MEEGNYPNQSQEPLDDESETATFGAALKKRKNDEKDSSNDMSIDDSVKKDKPKKAKKKRTKAKKERMPLEDSQRRNGYDSFSIFIYKVLKIVHNDVGISQNAMDVMDSMMEDIMERIVNASQMGCKNGNMTQRHIILGTSMVLPPNIRSAAIAFANQRLKDYISTSDGKEEFYEDSK